MDARAKITVRISDTEIYEWTEVFDLDPNERILRVIDAKGISHFFRYVPQEVANEVITD